MDGFRTDCSQNELGNRWLSMIPTKTPGLPVIPLFATVWVSLCGFSFSRHSHNTASVRPVLLSQHHFLFTVLPSTSCCRGRAGGDLSERRGLHALGVLIYRLFETRDMDDTTNCIEHAYLQTSLSLVFSCFSPSFFFFFSPAVLPFGHSSLRSVGSYEIGLDNGR